MGAVIAVLEWLVAFLKGEKSDADAKAAADRQREAADQAAAAARQRVIDAEHHGDDDPDGVQHSLDNGTFFGARRED